MTNKIGAGIVRRFKPIFVHIFALHCNKNFEDLKAEYGLNIHAYNYIYNIYIFIYLRSTRVHIICTNCKSGGLQHK